MRFLLTSMGVSNPTIRQSLVDLLGRPIEECSALLVPTAIHPFSVGPEMAHRFITGTGPTPAAELGWRSLGVLELTALPTVDRAAWVGAVEEADALLVYGGDPHYLRRRLQDSGMAELLPTLDLVWVGISAGALVTAPTFAEPTGDPDRPHVVDTGLGLVDVTLVPHMADDGPFPATSRAAVAAIAADLAVPVHGIDDHTAIVVDADGTVEIVTEGHWELFDGSRPAPDPAG